VRENSIQRIDAVLHVADTPHVEACLIAAIHVLLQVLTSTLMLKESLIDQAHQVEELGLTGTFHLQANSAKSPIQHVVDGQFARKV
jgi:hypothetical protein